VINKGFITNWFQPSKGVRQGWPLSPYLFNLSAEILCKVLKTKWALEIVNEFGKLDGLSSNVGKPKATWLGKWKKIKETDHYA